MTIKNIFFAILMMAFTTPAFAQAPPTPLETMRAQFGVAAELAREAEEHVQRICASWRLINDGRASREQVDEQLMRANELPRLVDRSLVVLRGLRVHFFSALVESSEPEKVRQEFNQTEEQIVARFVSALRTARLCRTERST